MNLDALALMLLTVLQTPPTSEYRERRERLLARHADGIVLLHARSTASGLGDQGFKQDASFFYLTGLVSQPSAILALDGPKREAVLFVPDAPRSFGFPWQELVSSRARLRPACGSSTASFLGTSWSRS